MVSDEKSCPVMAKLIYSSCGTAADHEFAPFNLLTRHILPFILIFNISNIIPAMKENYKPQAKIFKALTHPVRLAILNILRSGEECVCHMEAVLGYRQAYISQHLMLLREAGLIQDRRDGWNIFYRVTKPEVFALIDATGEMAGESSRQVSESPPARKKVPGCPCPKCNHGLNCGSPPIPKDR
jgi:DNA-binding transcriptional ArsR family regulator